MPHPSSMPVPDDADDLHEEHGGGQGPKPKPVSSHDNEQPVAMPDDHATGLEIKQRAIDAGVSIELDFVLVEELENGRTKNIADGDEVKLKAKSRFLANDGDDNS
jgi:hypothetical protein